MTWTTTTRVSSDGKLHLSCAETAKLVRGALKKAFPTTKFSVRSDHYSGGASIHVTYTDGPTSSSVHSVIDGFSGAGFDGMIDLKFYNDHWLLPDGSVTLAHRASGASTIPERYESAPSPDARLASFGADFVMIDRSESAEVTERLAAEVAAYTGVPYNENGLHPVSTFVTDGGGVGLAQGSHVSFGTHSYQLVWGLFSGRDFSKPCDCPGGEALYGCGNGVSRCAHCGKVVSK